MLGHLFYEDILADSLDSISIYDQKTIKIINGNLDDVMIMLQLVCDTCGHTWYNDLKRSNENGTWIDSYTCPNCLKTEIDKSVFHAYNLDCRPYVINPE